MAKRKATVKLSLDDRMAKLKTKLTRMETQKKIQDLKAEMKSLKT